MMTTALAAVVVAATAPVQAQSANAPGQPGRASFNIPAQPLSRALVQFSNATGTQLFFDASLVRGRNSPGVSGALTRGEALGRLLAGSGLVYHVSGNTVTITGPTGAAGDGTVDADGAVVLETITVQGSNPNSTMTLPGAYAGGQVATGGQVGLLGNRDVMNSPFSQINYTNKTIRDQQAQTVNDILDNNPSVVASSTGGRHESTTIRGFQDTGRYGPRSLNGLSGMAPMEFASTDYVERVDVLLGASALLNGMPVSGYGQGIGGSINLVTKRAADEPITQLTTRYISDAQFGAHVDVGRRFGPANEFGVRFNGALTGGDTSVNKQNAKDNNVALNVDYRGERFRFSGDFIRQSQNQSPSSNVLFIRRGLGTLTGIPRAPDASKSLFPSWEDRDSITTLGMANAELDFNDNLTAFAAIGAQRLSEDLKLTGPASITDLSGRYDLSAWRQRSNYDVFSTQGGVRGTAVTGPVGHAFSVAASHATYSEAYGLWTGDAFTVDSLYDPRFPSRMSFGKTSPIAKVSENKTSSIAFADTLSFLDGRIQLIGGIRYQTVEQSGQWIEPYDSSAWTPSVGLVVKPWENVSLYGSYIEGLQAGSTVGIYYANAGEVFAPYVSKQYEAGVKVDWGTATTTLGVFQISQPNTLTTADPNGGLPTLSLNGERRTRGVELNVYGEAYDGVRLLGGITLLDGRQTKTAGGALNGERASSTPKFRAVAGAEWDTPFVDGLTLTGRLTYTSNQVVDNSRPDLRLPSWTQVDLGGRYSFASPWNGNPITVRFNVDNVFDKNYWKTSYANGMIALSEPRTFRLSTEYRF